MRNIWSHNMFEVFVAAALTLAALAIFAARLTNAVETYPLALSVTDAWARPTADRSATGAVYLKVRNTGSSDDRLIAVRSPVSEKAELHHTRNDAGVMRIRRTSGGVPVPARAVFVLEPGGHHVMLTGLKTPLEKGQAFPLVLVFEKAGETETNVVVNIMPPSQAAQRGSH